MASQSLISTVNGYENYIKDKGKDEQVINAYVDACSVAINGAKNCNDCVLHDTLLFG